MSEQQKQVQKEVAAHVAQPEVASGLVSFFVTVFLPILPGLLQAAAPKILSNPKLITVLTHVDEVLDSILGKG